MSMSDERITLPETRDAHRRLITIAAAVLAQRTWGEPVARIQSGEMDDALALLAGQLREVADSLAAVERAARADERDACAAERDALLALLIECRCYITGDVGWDYDSNKWLPDRIDDAINAT